jgi:hypothetical protein
MGLVQKYFGTISLGLPAACPKYGLKFGPKKVGWILIYSLCKHVLNFGP